MDAETWAESFARAIKNTVVAFLWLIVVVVIAEMGKSSGNSITTDEAIIYAIIPGLCLAYYGIKATLYAAVCVLWPLLLILGIVGGQALEKGAEAVDKIKEDGLKSVADRIWYGKKGPRN